MTLFLFTYDRTLIKNKNLRSFAFFKFFSIESCDQKSKNIRSHKNCQLKTKNFHLK